MNKFTAGPWQIKSAQEPDYIIGAIDGPDDGTMYYKPVAMVSETEDFAANALLIAAAPDLLKACRQALVLLKGREHDGFLRDVIEKATGAKPWTLFNSQR